MSEARPIRDAVETVIFGTETRGGNLFDVALLMTILASVTVVMLDSMDVYHAVYGDLFRTLEISFTLVFTVEYLVRLWCLRNPVAYAISFWGVIDLLAILPTLLTLFVPVASSLIVIRVLRVLRVFRILHLWSRLASSQNGIAWSRTPKAPRPSEPSIRSSSNGLSSSSLRGRTSRNPTTKNANLTSIQTLGICVSRPRTPLAFAV